jgi:hypothetical protein
MLAGQPMLIRIFKAESQLEVWMRKSDRFELLDRAGVFLYLQPIFIAGLAYAFLGERLRPYHLAGAALILVGVLLVTLIKPRPALPSER